MRLNALLASLRRARDVDEAADVLFRQALTVRTGIPRGHLWVRGTVGPRLVPMGATGAAISLTVREEVQQSGEFVLVDLVRGRARSIQETAWRDFGLNTPSRLSLVDCGAQAVAALPVRRPGGRVAGVVSFELPTTELAEAVVSELQDAVDIAGPYLLELPARSTLQAEPPVPVVGSTMGDVLARLERFARTEEPVLLHGESGVGKSRLARWVADVSGRVGRFQAVQLQGLSPELLASRLFGHVRGAFTGADQDREGVVELAKGGTLFIDEVDKMTLESQAALLRLLDDQSYRALGDPAMRRADVRFVIGTNRDLMALVDQGDFLEDLFHRIDVLSVRLPALRERPEEVVPWFRHMLAQTPLGDVELDAEVEDLLCAHPWRGNLRELRSVAVRLASDLPPHTRRIDARSVRESLRAQRPERPVVAAMRTAAAAFVDAAEQGHSLGLDDARVFRGYVLQCAEERHGVAEAYRLLGRGGTVAASNHQRLFREQQSRVQDLEARLGGDPEGRERGPT